MRSFSAPGKLVIAGEYAVVEGRPALVAAVDRRAVCRVEAAPVLQVSALGRGPLVAREQWGEIFFPDDDTGAFALTAAVMTEAMARGVELPTAHIVLESDRFSLRDRQGRPLKLGLGSSAAVAVALAAALTGDASRAELLSILRVADAGHRRFSQGRGSGVDVAAAAWGGVIRFEREGPGRPMVAEPWPLCPPGLSLVCAFAGESTSTRAFLEGVEAFAGRDRAQHLQSMDEIERGTLELLEAAQPGEDPRVFLAAIDRCRRALQRLGERAGVDIVSAPHREIAKIARAFGGAAKPSGAGGGDVAICFVPHDARAALSDALEAAGYPVTLLEVGAPGVREEPT